MTEPAVRFAQEDASPSASARPAHAGPATGERASDDRRSARASRSGDGLLPLVPAAIAVALLAGWEALARLEWIPTLFFPAPSLILATTARFLLEEELAGQALATVRRVAVALAMGGLPGLALGLALGWSPRLHRIVDPFIAALHPVPKISTLPLIMIVFGIGAFSKTLVVAVSAFFPIVIAAMSGVRQIDPTYFEVARNYGADTRRIFTRVVLPGSLPTTLAGARIAINAALSMTIAVELLMAQNGLGSVIWFSWQTLRVEELYAGILVIALLGVGFRVGLNLLSKWLVPWQPGSQSG